MDPEVNEQNESSGAEQTPAPAAPATNHIPYLEDRLAALEALDAKFEQHLATWAKYVEKFEQVGIRVD